MQSFVLKLVPPTTTAQQKGYNRQTGRFYTKPKVQEAADRYWLALLPHRPPKRITGPVMLIVEFYYPTGKSHKEGDWKTSKPDTDNSIKLLKDVMTKVGFWQDDAQVCLEQVRKKYSSSPRIEISIDEL